MRLFPVVSGLPPLGKSGQFQSNLSPRSIALIPELRERTLKRLSQPAIIVRLERPRCRLHKDEVQVYDDERDAGEQGYQQRH